MTRYVTFNLLRDKKNIAVIKTNNGYTHLTCINKKDAGLIESLLKNSTNKIVGYIQEI